MNARVLGIDFVLGDGLVIEGAPALDVPGPDLTRARSDPAQVHAALDAANLADDGLARIRYVPGHGWLVAAHGVGAAVVSDDGRLVACAEQADSPDWPALFTAQVVPLVATLRGMEVFHAAGVLVDGGAHLLCGPQGVGKTSLATQLVLAGAELLADDVVAVDGALVAHQGPIVLHVRSGERANVERHRGGAALSWDGEAQGRARLRLATPAVSAAPLTGIHLLTRRSAGAPVMSVAAPEPVALLGATFTVAVATPPRLLRPLELCERLAREVAVCELRIIPGREAPELAARLLAHLRSPTPTPV